MLLNNRYSVIQQLGQGGFGTTYLGEDTHLPSRPRCVVKELKPQGGIDLNLAQERFAREAVMLEQLGQGHPQIPQLFAYFQEAEKFYLVQEYIAGKTLAAKVATEGPYSEADAIALLLQTLPILSYIHSQGVIHRDIKPDNIIERKSNGKPVLIDFGAVKETLGGDLDPTSVAPTIIIGTAGFMAAEQAAGRPMFASDLYSLAMTVIYLLTQASPQSLPSDPHTGQIQWRQKAANLNLSPALREILDRAIAPPGRDRFRTADEMLRAVQAASVPVTVVHGSPAQTAIPPTILDPVRPTPTPPSDAPPRPQPEGQPEAIATPQASQPTGATASRSASTPEPLPRRIGLGWIVAGLVLAPLGMVFTLNALTDGAIWEGITEIVAEGADPDDPDANLTPPATDCPTADSCPFFLSPGFSPDPQTGTGNAGGALPIATVTGVVETPAGQCQGFVKEIPDHFVVLDGPFDYLSMGVSSTAQLSIAIVELGSGSAWCHAGADPFIYGNSWAAGEYAVYIGNLSAPQPGDRYQFAITQVDTTSGNNL